MGNLVDVYGRAIVSAPAVLAKGSQIDAVLDLSSGTYAGALGATLTFAVGKTDSANDLTSGVIVRVFRQEGDGAGAEIGAPSLLYSQIGRLGKASIKSTLTGAHSASANTLTVSAYTQANLTNGEWAMLFGAAAARCEFVQLGLSASTTSIKLLTPLGIAHNNADTITNLADVWSVDVPVGGRIHVNCDYLTQAAGDDVIFGAWATIRTSVSY